MLPGKSGFDILRDIRRTSAVPVLMLTARGDTLDKVVGLELGADDYIEKPFEPKELLARVKAILRRVDGQLDSFTDQQTVGKSHELVQIANLVVDKASFSVKVGDVDIDMAPKELELFFFLASHPNRVFTREQLLDNIWGFDFYGESRTVDVHI